MKFTFQIAGVKPNSKKFEIFDFTLSFDKLDIKLGSHVGEFHIHSNTENHTLIYFGDDISSFIASSPKYGGGKCSDKQTCIQLLEFLKSEQK